MSLKIEELKIQGFNKKQSFNFDSKNYKKIGFIYYNKKSYKGLIKTICGKNSVKNGDIFLNNREITTLLPKDRKIVLIKKYSLRLKFLPTKLLLNRKILFNAQFLHESFNIYYDNKYKYKLLSKAFDNKDLLNLFWDIDTIIEKYLNSFIQQYTELTKKFVIESEVHNIKQINDLFI